MYALADAIFSNTPPAPASRLPENALFTPTCSCCWRARRLCWLYSAWTVAVMLGWVLLMAATERTCAVLLPIAGGVALHALR